MERVDRQDFAPLGKIEKTPQGFLKIPANLTRVGVLTYRRADGSSFRELRLPEEVFSQKSLDSLKNAPVTDLHPTEMVTSANVRTLQRGVVREDVAANDRFVTATVLVQDSDLITKIERRDRCELSPGYSCTVEVSAGEWQGEKYDGIQRDIVYNHLAVGPRGWARSGPEVRLHLDSAWGENVKATLTKIGKTEDDLAKHLQLETQELILKLDGWDPPSDKLTADVASYLNDTGKNKMDMIQVKIGQATFAVEKSVGLELQKASDALTARLDSIGAELTAAKAAAAPEVIAKAVATRVALEGKASKVLGAEVKLDGLTDRDVRVAAIKKADPQFNADGRSDAYVEARFDLLNVEATNTQKQVDAAKTGPIVESKKDGKEEESARQKYVKQMQGLASQPLAFSAK